MVVTTEQCTHKVTYNRKTKHYEYRVPGPGNVVAMSSNKQLLSDFLDTLELQWQCDDGQRIPRHDTR